MLDPFILSERLPGKDLGVEWLQMCRQGACSDKPAQGISAKEVNNVVASVVLVEWAGSTLRGRTRVVAIVGDAALGDLSDLEAATNSLSGTFVGLLMGAGLLVILGLPGLYARQAERAGVLGLISFVTTFVGLLFSDVIATEKYAFLFPKLAASPEGRALLNPSLPNPQSNLPYSL